MIEKEERGSYMDDRDIFREYRISLRYGMDDDLIRMVDRMSLEGYSTTDIFKEGLKAIETKGSI